MTSIVSKGKDVKEAINVGLELLGLMKDQVSIEIIEREKRGIMRIGSKPAVVKITRNSAEAIKHQRNVMNDELALMELIEQSLQDDKPQELPQKEIEQQELQSLVWVKDGQVGCKTSNSSYPTIEAGKGCKILKNKELVKGTTVVTEHDLIEIHAEEVEEKQTVWKVHVDASKLRVHLNITPGYKISRKIADIEPDEHIVVEAQETKEVLNHLNYETVIGELNRIGVKHGFNHQTIMVAIETLESGSFEIATGVEPKLGKDGWFEALVDLDSAEGPKERADGTVDFREIKSFTSVRKGQVIGVVHDPIPGIPGVTVTNEPIPPKQTFPMVLREGKGVISIENGKKVVATDTGRPHIKQRGMLLTISVMPKLVRNGDVDLESGNIRFKGDVDINGSVNDGMTVESEGDIFISESVSRATITSNSAVQVSNNVISSDISAGKSNMVIAELGQLLVTIVEMVDKMVVSMEQLVQSPAFKLSDFSRSGIYPLIRILMEKKFKALPPLIKQFCEISKKGDSFLEEEWLELVEQMKKCFLTPVPAEFQTLESFRELATEMARLYEVSQTKVEPNAYVTAMYALNSTIYSSGNVHIFGQGSYNTKIYSGGKVQINGLLRGGELFAQQGIEVNEVGSDTAVVTKLMVPRDQQIIAKKVMEGTIFQIGSVKYKFMKDQGYVKAKLSEGQILLY